MPGFGDVLQKAIYLGVGLATFAGEKAGSTLSELRNQIQKLADEMVERGEMSTDEARRFVEDMMNKARQAPPETTSEPQSSEPRRIEILSDDEEPSTSASPKVDDLRQQVQSLQDELRRLKKDS